MEKRWIHTAYGMVYANPETALADYYYARETHIIPIIERQWEILQAVEAEFRSQTTEAMASQ